MERHLTGIVGLLAMTQAVMIAFGVGVARAALEPHGATLVIVNTVSGLGFLIGFLGIKLVVDWWEHR